MRRPRRPHAARAEPKAGPVTVTQLPLVRCAVCGRTLAHQRGQAGEVLSQHYQERHSEVR